MSNQRAPSPLPADLVSQHEAFATFRKKHFPEWQHAASREEREAIQHQALAKWQESKPESVLLSPSGDRVSASLDAFPEWPLLNDSEIGGPGDAVKIMGLNVDRKIRWVATITKAQLRAMLYKKRGRKSASPLVLEFAERRWGSDWWRNMPKGMLLWNAENLCDDMKQAGHNPSAVLTIARALRDNAT